MHGNRQNNDNDDVLLRRFDHSISRQNMTSDERARKRCSIWSPRADAQRERERKRKREPDGTTLLAVSLAKDRLKSRIKSHEEQHNKR